MNYCAPSDIIPVIPQAKLKKLLAIEEDGDVPSSKIEPYITLVEDQVDGVLSFAYQMPATDPRTIKVLKAIVVGLTIEMMFSLNAEDDIPKSIDRVVEFGRAELMAYAGRILPGGVSVLPTKVLPYAAKTVRASVRSNPRIDFNSVLGYRSAEDRIST